MVSIIICSRNEHVLARIKANVEATIGVPYEIVAIDNSTGKYGICEAYNIGAQKSKFGILCFMHEDIHFVTTEWGKVVVTLLEDATIGVLGIAGGTQQLNAPAGWTGGGHDCVRMNIIHDIKGEQQTLDYVNPTPFRLVDVATLDGVWLCARKEVWERYNFDKEAFPAFHFYDIDFCTRIFSKYRICVTFDILIKHFSRGSFDNTWCKYAVQYYRKRHMYLPFGVAEMSKKEEERLSLKRLREFTSDFIDRKISTKDSLYLVKECLSRSRFHRDSWWLVKKLLLSNLLIK